MEQNRSDINHGAAPSCAALEGSLGVLLTMKGLMEGQPNGSTGRCAGGMRANIDYIHVYMGTRRREIEAHRHTQSLRRGYKK